MHLPIILSPARHACRANKPPLTRPTSGREPLPSDSTRDRSDGGKAKTTGRPTTARDIAAHLPENLRPDRRAHSPLASPGRVRIPVTTGRRLGSNPRHGGRFHLLYRLCACGFGRVTRSASMYSSWRPVAAVCDWPSAVKQPPVSEPRHRKPGYCLGPWACGNCYKKRHARLFGRVLDSGRGDWIRTSDHLNPIQVRYQTALHPAAGQTPSIIIVYHTGSGGDKGKARHTRIS